MSMRIDGEFAKRMNEAADDLVTAAKDAKAVKAKIETFEREHIDLRDRVENIEAMKSLPARLGFDVPETAESRQHKHLFTNWIRQPKNSEANRKLTEFEMNSKSVSVASSAGGGYAVPEEIGRDIERMQLKYSPVRDLVKVSRASTSDIKRLVDLTGADGGWRSESGSVSETNTPQLREITPTGGELYAYPKCSNWSLEDIFFDVRGWLVESVSRKFAQLEGTSVISGDGSNKPTGMLATTPVTTADDAVSPRAAAAYQYILGGDNSPASIDTDGLNDLIFATNSAYRANGSWVMNSLTAGQVAKLKDTTGRPLWQPSLQVGMPPVLLGFPVSIWEQMPDPLGGAFPIAFGDFRAGYELIDRSDMTITVDPYSAPGFTKFYVRKRVYGHVSNNDAIKFLKLL